MSDRPSAPRLADCTALILAGGDSSRMNGASTSGVPADSPVRSPVNSRIDKAELRLPAVDGQTLLARAVALCQPLFAEVLVSGRTPRASLSGQGLREVLDGASGLPELRGPLAGLCAGLAAARTPWLYILAVDMPFMRPDLILQLASYRQDGLQAVVPLIDGHAQGQAAFYASSALPAIREQLEQDRTPGRSPGFRHVLAALATRWVTADELAEELAENNNGLSAQAFFDIDTPADQARAETFHEH